MNSLDYHVLREISEHLSYPDYLAFIGTCKRFYELKDIRKKIGYLEELRKEDILFKRQKLSTFASRKGQLDVIKYLHSNNALFTHHAINWAAGKCHLGVVIWLHENRTEGCTQNAIIHAHRNNHHEIVQYLHEKYGFEIPQ